MSYLEDGADELEDQLARIAELAHSTRAAEDPGEVLGEIRSLVDAPAAPIAPAPSPDILYVTARCATCGEARPPDDRAPVLVNQQVRVLAPDEVLLVDLVFDGCRAVHPHPTEWLAERVPGGIGGPQWTGRTEVRREQRGPWPDYGPATAALGYLG